MRVFISYRRDDSSVHARLLHRELSSYFGADHVFMDYEDIGWGDDFAARIDASLDRADVVVVVVGPRWAEMVQHRLRGDDWVRREVEQALRLRAAGRLRVLPVLVGGARWDGAALPRGLAELALLNAPVLRDAGFDQDVVAVVEAIRQRRLWQELVAVARARQARLAGLALGLAAAVGAWTGVLGRLGIDTWLNTTTMALAAMSGPAPAPSDELVLVSIDEASVRAVGRPLDASWRDEHARLVDRVRDAGARSLAFDLFFDAPGASGADASFAASIARAAPGLPVLLAVQELAGAAASPGTGRPDHEPIAADGGAAAVAPRLLPALSAAGAGWGVACAGRRLGVAYAMPLAAAAPDGEPAYPSLALAAFAGPSPVGRIGQSEIAARTLHVPALARGGPEAVGFFEVSPLGREQPACPVLQRGHWLAQQLIDPARLAAAGARVEYAQVLHGDPVALTTLRGRIVLVGPTLQGVDQIAVAGGPPRWGVELIAAQIDGLLQRRAVRAAGPWTQAALGLAIGFVGAAVAVALHGRHAAVLAGAVAGLALLVGAAVVAWYRLDGQLLGVHYGWVALVLAALAARRIMRSAL
ncbi:MAG: CHASE2 domain-containing protein [Burkholderiales bacterium]|nr:CHASE2 domain-containing protein [Burkholderiales bacterium]